MGKKTSKTAATKKNANTEATESSVDLSQEDDVDVEPTVGVSGNETNVASPEMKATAQSQAHDTVMRITEVVINALDALKDGEKTTLKELQNLVAEQTGLKGSNIGPVISMIVKTHGGITVELGRYGGIYKGVRVRPEKPVDTKPRCAHCHQVIRQKTGPRKKKNADGTTIAAATTDDANGGDFDEDDLEDDLENEESDESEDSEQESLSN